MRIVTLCLAGFVMALPAGNAFGQATSQAIIHNNFEEDFGDWTGFGQHAKVTVSHDPANIKQGKGSLLFNYTTAKGELNALILPTPNGAVTKMKSLHFWIRSDHETPVVVALQEKEGGRYSSIFSVPADKWQEVTLAPSDFYLGEDKTDPKDPDGKLDLDKVESVSIADFGQFFAQIDNEALASLFSVAKGDHKLLMSDFSVTEEKPASAIAESGKEPVLDTPERPQVSWLGIGEMKLQRASGKPLVGLGMRVDYHQAPGKLTGLLKHIHRGVLTGMDQLAFSIASSKPAKIIVQLEEIGGGKYKTVVDVPGGTELRELWLRLTDFQPAEDSHDDNGHLDLDQVHQIVFIDVSGFTDNSDQDNTLWINKLRGAPK